MKPNPLIRLPALSPHEQGPEFLRLQRALSESYRNALRRWLSIRCLSFLTDDAEKGVWKAFLFACRRRNRSFF
jgi:hypothetical protein